MATHPLMRTCRSCGIPLWLAWALFGLPWQRRLRSYADATDCIHLLVEP